MIKLCFSLFVIFSFTHVNAQLKTYQKNYFAVDDPQHHDTLFEVFGVFTDSVQKGTDYNKIKFNYVPGYSFSQFSIADTAVHPLGRYIILHDSQSAYSIIASYDTILLPEYSRVSDIFFSYKKTDKYILRRSYTLPVVIPETGSDSVVFWDLYSDMGSVQKRVCENWYGIAKNNGLYVFHDLNRPDSIGAKYFRIPYRKPDLRRILNYQPGDWLEYTEQCDFQYDLSGPEDYFLIEILTRYNDSQYKVKVTTINVTAGNMKLNYDTTIKIVDKSSELCDCGLRIYSISVIGAPGNLYNLGGWYKTPHTTSYDTLNKRFLFSPYYYETPTFEPRYDGCSAVESIGVTAVFRSNFQSLTNRCSYLHSAHIAGVTDFGSRMIGVKEIAEKELNIYPNPADDFVYISGNINSRADIYNAQGGLILSGNINSEQQVNLSGIAPGIYFIRVDHHEPVIIIKSKTSSGKY